jgi:hypothetical protein
MGVFAMRAFFLLVCLAAWSFSVRAQPADTHFQIDIGVGTESQTSPVFQISPEGNILYLDGSQGLRGTHVRTNVQGSADWTWDGGVSTSFAADATVKHSPGTQDLDFASISLQPSVHMPWGAGSVGAGLNWLSYDVGGHHFRDATGLQVDWTQSDGQNLWAIVAEVSAYRHAQEFAEMDAIATSVVVLRQFTDPLPGIDGLDFSAIVGKEVNDHGYLDLASHSAMVHAMVRWSWLGADWSLGTGWRAAVFEESAFPNEPVRADHTVMTDIAAQWPLSSQHSIRVEFNDMNNTSNTHLYDNTHQQLSITWRSSW